MFDGIKNSFKGTANTSRRAIKEIAGMAKEVKNMPWKKLKFTQWLYIIFGIIVFIIIAFKIFPMMN